MRKKINNYAGLAEFLAGVGIENIDDGLFEVKFSCPFPGHTHGDQKPSAYMNKETGLYYCHGCKTKGNIFTFISEYKCITKREATNIIEDYFNTGYIEPDNFYLEIDSLFRKKLKKDNSAIFYSLARLPSKAKEYLSQRTFDLDFLDKLGIGYDPISNRIAIPIYHEQGYLIGYKARAIDELQQPKYIVLGDKTPERNIYGFPTYDVSKVVFGLYRQKRGSCLILVEGEFDAIKLWQYGIGEAIGVGSNFSSFHADKIVEYASEVIVFMDSDPAGDKAQRAIYEKLIDYVPVCAVTPHRGDPASMSEAEVRELLRAAPSLDALWLREGKI